MSEELFTFTAGTRTPRVMIVGDVLSRDDASSGSVFTGTYGHEMRKMLTATNIPLEHCFFTSVVPERPEANDLTAFFNPSKSKSAPVRGLQPRNNVLAGLTRLQAQIAALKPQLVIGCGNLPLWALTDKAGVSSVRGTKLPSGVSKWRGSQLRTRPEMGSVPFLPIYHPAEILRSYADKFPTIHDLSARAGRFLRGERSWERQRTTTSYWNPTYHEAARILRVWLYEVKKAPLVLSVDIETWRRKEIVCIGFADDKLELCIPFFYFNSSLQSVDVFKAEEEIDLILAIRELLNHPNIRIVGQNYIYDYQYLSRKLKIFTPVSYDTMLMHHLLWPGTPKGLDYLASLYSDHYVYWKDESNEWDGSGGHEQLWRYNCKDVRETYDIAVELREQVTKSNMQEQYDFQLEQWVVAAEMTLRGIRRDKARFDSIRKETSRIASEHEEWLLNIMPPDLRFTSIGGCWFQSPIFSMKIFYEILGLPPVMHKKTKRPTFNYESFETLKKRAPWLTIVFDKLEEYRSIGVFNSHFLDITFSPTDRLCCNFNIGGTETFRWSSSSNAFGEGTNFQNIPKGNEE